ncbi:hypothetical protein ALC57_10316 [Trachymyrmex cornetzi]|uniref:Uncharacterized protein n=1 Tax=Trachymyrmex cornetzi TaxID=471704 RepID=A0A195DWQ4_9HYME|nr:hypothetical protein ALC57_10316 [Trachymyrmex cornetzi]
MEDGKPATVRELTTFFRFSRGGGCAERAVGVHGLQKLDQRGDVLPHH